MELLPHLLEHAFEDTIYLVPFLLATYILLSFSNIRQAIKQLS